MGGYNIENKRTRRKKNKKDEMLDPLRIAASKVALLLQNISECSELFVTEVDGAPKKLDAKALKEFSAVIKEVSGVICELNGISKEEEKEREGVLIEFDQDSEECSQ